MTTTETFPVYHTQRKSNYDVILGAHAVMLRRLGFYRAKETEIFFRHLVGIGGVYFDLRTRTLTVRELDLKRVIKTSSELKTVFEELSLIDAERATEWHNLRSSKKVI